MANKTKPQKKSQNRKPVPQAPRSLFGNIFFYVFLLFGVFALVTAFSGYTGGLEVKPLGEAISLIKEGKAQDVIVANNKVEILLQDGTQFVTDKESTVSFDEILTNNDIDRSLIVGEYKVEHRVGAADIIGPLLTFGFPVLILLLIFRQMRGAGGGDIFAFGKSKARLFNQEAKKKITFKDVAGVEEAKTEMYEIVDFLKHPDKYRKLGARIPKGILLVGPAGVGKTLLAKAIAGEANVPFFSVAGSEFMEMLVGVGSARARDLFKMAKASQPSLIFIDEVDAIGRQRGMGIGGGHDEREQTLNQILIEMDGFDPRTNVIVLAATNRPDMLDPALVRAGRFDRQVTIPLPDLEDRTEIMKIHMRGKPFDKNVSLERVAKKTVGFSGADIENMLNEAAILAARDNKTKISPKHLDEAALKVTMGSERKTLQTDEEKKLTAYHEAGHALVAAKVPDMDPVNRVSIVARGGSLGHTSMVPIRDRYNETETRLRSFITTMLGGRAAEEVVYDEFTVGASDDISKATKIARKMVMQLGMSDLGPISFNGGEEATMLAREFSHHAPAYSNEVAGKIDAEVKKIVDSCYEDAKKIVREGKPVLDKVVDLLMEKETIDEDEFSALLD